MLLPSAKWNCFLWFLKSNLLPVLQGFYVRGIGNEAIWKGCEENNQLPNGTMFEYMNAEASMFWKLQIISVFSVWFETSDAQWAAALQTNPSDRPLYFPFMFESFGQKGCFFYIKKLLYLKLSWWGCRSKINAEII